MVIQMNQTVSWILDHWGFCAFVLTCVIQITPVIKWNPITALFTWIGQMINKDVMREVKEIKEVQKQQQFIIDENEKDRIRFEVLDFANSCRNKRKHTKDEFQHIIVIVDKYDKLLLKTDDKNGVFESEYEYIREIYKQCQHENSFL